MLCIYIFSGILSACVLLEMIIRLHKDIPLLRFGNFLETKLDLLQSRYPAFYDAAVGHIPTPGYSGTGNTWKKQVTILEHGIRSNGRPPRERAEPPVLCVGDSFTFGDMVSDQDTWPAYLEAMLDRPVLNGGVFGYGLDQTVLRAEQLIPLYTPGMLLLGFIPSDIKRTHYKVRTGVNKPYFTVENNALVPHNIPVPPTRPKKEDLGWFRAVFGYSCFVDWSMKHLGLYNWWNLGRWGSERVHQDGVQVCALLLQRINELCRERGISLLVVVQYNERHVLNPDSGDVRLVRSMLRHEAVQGLDVLDTMDTLREFVAANGEEALADLYDESHMSPAGNRLTAQAIHTRISL